MQPTSILMNKVIPDKLFFKIGEVAVIADVEQHVLRYWEDEFNVLKPGKNRAGQRLYQKKDVEQVLEIKRLLYSEKYTIAGAKIKLKGTKNKNVQMAFGYDLNSMVKAKKKIKSDLQAILKILGDGNK
jgi:DNA-binding transcriptional MerR regulator